MAISPEQAREIQIYQEAGNEKEVQTRLHQLNPATEWEKGAVLFNLAFSYLQAGDEQKGYEVLSQALFSLNPLRTFFIKSLSIELGASIL